MFAAIRNAADPPPPAIKFRRLTRVISEACRRGCGLKASWSIRIIR
jgi:hypothetical protein